MTATVSVTKTAPDTVATPTAGGWRHLLAHPAKRKLIALAVGALVLIPVGVALWGSGSWPAELTVDVSGPLDDANQWVIDNRETHPLFLYFLLHLSNTATDAVDAVYQLLDAMGWLGVLVAGVLFAWRAAGLGRRGIRVAATAFGAFAVCGLLGMWDATLLTIALMVVSVAVAALLGVLIGLAAGLSDRVDRALRPVLDTMQVLPAFAYLLPFVLVFGTGTPAALFCTVIYAAPPMARLTALGLRGADPAALEASASLGASSWQRLRTARVPLARKEMLLGLNQTIMMCLSMVVLASVVGSGGLGDEIYTALSKLNVGQALAAGIAIVLLAVLLDRTTAAAGERMAEATTYGPDSGPAARLRGWPSWAGLAALGGVLAAVGPRLGQQEWPLDWTVNIAAPVNDFTEWFEAHLGEGIPVVGGTITWAENFANWVLNPLRSGLESTPWWALLLLVAALAWSAGRWRAAITATAAMALTGVLGLWTKSVDTLSQVLVGLLLTMVLGFLIGILAARVERVERLLRPVLDTMQTMPQFVYLVPMVALFAAGRTAGIAAAVVFVLPAVVRITAQGIKQVDRAAVEAARSMGATGWQELRQVQLPLARNALLVAVNQGVVLVLSMVVIGGMVGGGALGIDVITGLSRADLALGLPAGVAIVCLGIVLDRVTQPGTRLADRR